jgi:hypothetical protein
MAAPRQPFFSGDRSDGLAFADALGLEIETPDDREAHDTSSDDVDDPWAPPDMIVPLGLLEEAGPEDFLAAGHPTGGRTSDPFETLPTLVVHFQARALADAPLPPHLGSTIRGAIGQRLRPLACTTGAPSCAGCPVAARCAYGVLWEGAGAGPLGPLGRGDDAPRPYVLAWERPASRDRAPTPRLRRGDPLRFRLTLFGSARAHLATFLRAVADALAHGLGPRRAPFRLEWATTAALSDRPGQPSARATLLFAEDRLAPLHALPDTTLASLVDQSRAGLGPTLRLAFQTPLTLIEAGRPLDHIRLEVLAQRLVERIQRLAAAWGYHDPATPMPWERIVDLARGVRIRRVETHWVRFERESSRQRQRIPVEGLTGFVDLDEVPPELALILAAGEYTHIGKQATFGLGRITIRPR